MKTSWSVGIGLAALVILAGCAGGTSDFPASGLVPSANLETEGETATVTIPSGVLDFTVGAPVTELTQEQTADGESYSARSGYVFVPVSWVQKDTAPWFGLGLEEGAQFPAADLTISSGGQLTDLGDFDLAAGKSSGASWVRIPEGGDVTVSVTFAGETQTVNAATGAREAGAAAGYYSEGVPVAPRCPNLRSEPNAALKWTASCSVDGVAQVPYLASGGWAGDGRTWLVVDLTVIPMTATARDSEYAIGRQPTEGATTLDGENPEEVLVEEGPEPGFSSIAFRVDADSAVHQLAVRRTFDLRRRSGQEGPAARRLNIDISMTIDTTR